MGWIPGIQTRRPLQGVAAVARVVQLILHHSRATVVGSSSSLLIHVNRIRHSRLVLSTVTGDKPDPRFVHVVRKGSVVADLVSRPVVMVMVHVRPDRLLIVAIHRLRCCRRSCFRRIRRGRCRGRGPGPGRWGRGRWHSRREVLLIQTGIRPGSIIPMPFKENKIPLENERARQAMTSI